MRGLAARLRAGSGVGRVSAGRPRRRELRRRTGRRLDHKAALRLVHCKDGALVHGASRHFDPHARVEDGVVEAEAAGGHTQIYPLFFMRVCRRKESGLFAAYYDSSAFTLCCDMRARVVILRIDQGTTQKKHVACADCARPTEDGERAVRCRSRSRSQACMCTTRYFPFPVACRISSRAP